IAHTCAMISATSPETSTKAVSPANAGRNVSLKTAMERQVSKNVPEARKRRLRAGRSSGIRNLSTRVRPRDDSTAHLPKRPHAARARRGNALRRSESERRSARTPQPRRLLQSASAQVAGEDGALDVVRLGRVADRVDFNTCRRKLVGEGGVRLHVV